MCPFADPFADATKGDDLLPAGTEDYIHIRIQQRNGRKTLTTVQGIADDYDKKKLVKAFKKVRVLERKERRNRSPGRAEGTPSPESRAGDGDRFSSFLLINTWLLMRGLRCYNEM